MSEETSMKSPLSSEKVVEHYSGESMRPSWQVESLRFTLFPQPSPEFPLLSWWNNLFDQPPQTENRDRRTSTSQLLGVTENRQVFLGSTPIRIDFVISAASNQVGEPSIGGGDFMLIGDYTSVQSSFLPLVHKLLNADGFPQIYRLAYGAALLIPVEKRLEGYKLLQGFLQTVKVDPDHTSDFLYQINRPVQLQAKSGTALSINRLSKWSVVLNNTAFLDFQKERNFSVTVPGKHALRLELDINTVLTEESFLNKDNIPFIIDELFKEATEIAKNGDPT